MSWLLAAWRAFSAFRAVAWAIGILSGMFFGHAVDHQIHAATGVRPYLSWIFASVILGIALIKKEHDRD